MILKQNGYNWGLKAHLNIVNGKLYFNITLNAIAIILLYDLQQFSTNNEELFSAFPIFSSECFTKMICRQGHSEVAILTRCLLS